MSNVERPPIPAERCTKMCCASFFSYKDTVLPHSPASLRNPIHPLFSPSQFHSQTTLPDPPSYASLNPSLQLATHFLTLPSIHTLLVIKSSGDLFLKDSKGIVRGTTWGEVDAWHEERPESVYTVSRHATAEHQGIRGEEMRRRAEEILLEAVPMVNFEFAVLDPGVGGQCLPVSGSLERELAGRFPRGCKSIVQINALHWSRFFSSAEHEVSSLTTVKFALLLIHELFHALEGVYNNAPWTETYYGDSAMSECGCEAENAIFGGILQGVSCAAPLAYYGFCEEAVKREGERVRSPAVMLRPWPSYPRLRRYGVLGSRVGVRWGYRGPEIEVVERLDSSFVEQLLSEEFWAAGVGPGPLVLPKVGEWAMEWCETRQAAIFVEKLEAGAAKERIWRFW